MLKMAIGLKPFSCGAVLFVHRDSAEDPLDDSGTVQQQLDQVTYMNIYQWCKTRWPNGWRVTPY